MVHIQKHVRNCFCIVALYLFMYFAMFLHNSLIGIHIFESATLDKSATFVSHFRGKSMSESATQTIGERLRLFRESKKLTQAQMADALDATTIGLQGNERGRALPNSKVLIGLYNLGLNVNWLLSGDGPMLLADSTTTDDDLKAYGECLEILELALNKFNRKLTPEKKRAAVDSLYRAWKREKRIDPQLVEMISQLAA